jgi:hypothetical protein
MDATPAGWRSFRSAMGISPPMMLGMMLGVSAAFGKLREAVLVDVCPEGRARAFDFGVGRAS